MSRRTWARLCCAGLFGMTAYPSVAQVAAEDTVARDVHTLDEVVVNAPSVARKTTATSPFQSLSQAQFLQQGVTDIADALRRFSGVNVKDWARSIRRWPTTASH